MSTEQVLEALIKNIGALAKEAYQLGYSDGVIDERSANESTSKEENNEQ